MGSVTIESTSAYMYAVAIDGFRSADSVDIVTCCWEHSSSQLQICSIEHGSGREPRSFTTQHAAVLVIMIHSLLVLLCDVARLSTAAILSHQDHHARLEVLSAALANVRHHEQERE